MENNTEMLADTTPMAETETPETDVNTEATPQAEAEAEEQGQSVPFVVNFNHEERELTHDEAVSFAQKGMKFDKIAGMLDDLSYLASIKGQKSHDLIKELIKAEEDAYRETVMDRHGDDNEVVEMLMEKYRTENRSKFEKARTDLKEAEEAEAKKAVETLEGRLADEFVELKKEFPEIESVADLPKEVLKFAKSGKNLTDAYLRYMHQEKKKVTEAKQTATVNSKASAGNMSSGENADPLLLAFAKSLRS